MQSVRIECSADAVKIETAPLQKAHLAGALLVLFRQSRAELLVAHAVGQLEPVDGGFFQYLLDERFVDLHAGQIGAYAHRADAAPDAAVDDGLSVAPATEQVIGQQVVDDFIDVCSLEIALA